MGSYRLGLLTLAAVLVVLCFLGLLGRFFYLQVVQYRHFATLAQANRIDVQPEAPNRGIITDRNGVVLASNYSAYTLELNPQKIADVDAAIDEVSKIVEISARDRRRFKRLYEEFRTNDSLPLKSRLSDEEVARVAANRFRLPGVEIKARLFRQYPFGEIASHVIGYIGRISQGEKERIEAAGLTANYKGSDYIGKVGIELSYEKELHGTPGARFGGSARGFGAWGGSTLETVDVRRGTLVIDLVDARRNALVWRGVTEGHLDDEAVKDPGPAIERAVAEVFAHFTR